MQHAIVKGVNQSTHPSQQETNDDSQKLLMAGKVASDTRCSRNDYMMSKYIQV